MRTLVIILVAVGILLGAAEVAVIAAAKALGPTPMGGAPLFAVWGAGSFVGGLLISRLGGGARTAAGVAVLLATLTAGHLPIPVDGNVVGLAAVLFIAGAAIAPTEASLYAMVGNAAPEGTITAAFAWLATAMAVGSAGGSAAAGVVVDRAGPAPAFALAGGAGALALLTSLRRSRTIGVSAAPAQKSAAPIPVTTLSST